MKNPMRVAVTGAAGHIGYALSFRIAAGDLLGADQEIVLQLLEIPPALDALEGVVMELRDCAFPLLADVVATTEPAAAFDEADVAILVGAKPRSAGMERKDLLSANAGIFGPQGKAIAEQASKNVRVLVVGNPANTNCLIAAANAKGLDAQQFSAMTRLDHNRGLAQVAARAECRVTDVRKMAIWGNHSSTQVPDLSHCTVRGEPALGVVGESWYRETFVPAVQQRGAEIIKARGASSAASAAAAAIDTVRDWFAGNRDDDWVSMAVAADGSYGIAPGVFYSFPCVVRDGVYEIVPGLELDDLTRERMQRSDEELREERAAVEELLG